MNKLLAPFVAALVLGIPTSSLAQTQRLVKPETRRAAPPKPVRSSGEAVVLDEPGAGKEVSPDGRPDARPSESLVGTTSRTTHRLGVLVGVLAEPIPSFFGLNLGYNALDWMRIQAGVGFAWFDASLTGGTDVSFTSFTAESQFLVPGISFSPVGLLGVGYVAGTASATVDNNAIEATAGSPYFFLGGGLDWQTWAGFTLQLHYKHVFAAGGSAGVPGIALGWFF